MHKTTIPDHPLVSQVREKIRKLFIRIVEQEELSLRKISVEALGRGNNYCTEALSRNDVKCERVLSIFFGVDPNIEIILKHRDNEYRIGASSNSLKVGRDASDLWLNSIKEQMREVLEECRQIEQITQLELSEKLGVPRSTIARSLDPKGQFNTQIDTLVAIAGELKCRVSISSNFLK